MKTICYGSEIVLRHEKTGKYLNTPGVPYTHPKNSGQDQVTCVDVVNFKSNWIVKPPHGYPDDYLYGKPVDHGAFLRLENRALQRNLHSHQDHPSPLSDQQEITCFGNQGIGDMNDNWRLEVDGEEIWQQKKRFRLIHTVTGRALHSHAGRSDPVTTSGGQEVTGYDRRDDNDYWTVEAKFGPIVPPMLAGNSRGTTWVSALHLVGSLASITGISLLFLGTALKTASFTQLLAIFLASAFVLGVFTAMALLLLQFHGYLRLKLCPAGWIPAMWLILFSIGMAAGFFLWYLAFQIATKHLEPLLREIFGVR